MLPVLHVTFISTLPSTSIASPEYAHKQIIVGANSLSGNHSQKLFSDIKKYDVPVSNSFSMGEPSKVIDTITAEMEMVTVKYVYSGYSSVSSSNTVSTGQGVFFLLVCFSFFCIIYNKLISGGQLYHRNDKLILYNDNLLVCVLVFHNGNTLLLIYFELIFVVSVC